MALEKLSDAFVGIQSRQLLGFEFVPKVLARFESLGVESGEIIRVGNLGRPEILDHILTDASPFLLYLGSVRVAK